MHFLAQTGSNKRPDGLSWSPDGKELAFERWDGEYTDIFIVSVVTRKIRPFTTDGKENIRTQFGQEMGGGLPIYRDEASGLAAADGSKPWMAASRRY